MSIRCAPTAFESIADTKASMQVSPIQTRSIIYRRVHVEPHLDADGSPDVGLNAGEFEWHGTTLNVVTGTAALPDEGSTEPTRFLVSLRLTVNNEKGKTCPYKFDVELAGQVQISDKLSLDRREELALVNGLAIVYGAARELISGLTARMEYGVLVLPGVNFQDQVSASEK